MKIFFRISLILVVLINCVSCVTTSTYGAKFEAISNDDTYTLKIYYGGPPPQFANNIDFQEGTESALYEEAVKFMEGRPEYIGYKIVNIEHSYIPSYYRYEVKFLRE
jgi:hypothetical protein